MHAGIRQARINVRNLMRSNWIDESVSARFYWYGQRRNRNLLLLLSFVHLAFENCYCSLTCDSDVNYDGRVMLSMWNQFVSHFTVELPQRCMYMHTLNATTDNDREMEDFRHNKKSTTARKHEKHVKWSQERQGF